MTLRQFCQREGHPYVTHVMVAEAGGIENVGKACLCGQRHEPMPNGTALRVLDPHAIDAIGRDRTA